MALFGSNSNGEWKKFAQEINATFNKGGIFKDESVTLSYKGLNIVMKLTVMATNFTTDVYTTIRCEFCSKYDFKFYIHDDEISSYISHDTDLTESRADEVDLNLNYKVKSNNKELVSSFLDNEELKTLLTRQTKLNFLLTSEMKASPQMCNNKIYFSASESITNTRRLKSLFKMFELTIDQLEEIGILETGEAKTIEDKVIQVKEENSTGKTEKEKMLAGEYYDAFDKELIRDRIRAKDLLFEFNNTKPSEAYKSNKLNQLINAKGSYHIDAPFYCDYGYNIEVGNQFYANHGCTILDVCRVTIGDNVLLAPHVQIYTATHPLNPTERKSGLEYAKAITIGNNVWIGGGAIICPGVTIGDNSVIGAGSVVTKDIPANVVAAGNPCRVIKAVE